MRKHGNPVLAYGHPFKTCANDTTQDKHTLTFVSPLLIAGNETKLAKVFLNRILK